mgnify:FL=1|uniref:HK97 gp10 family phage protein n=1 Tax=Siphoviridae sp. ctR5S1 TaxID=2825498 RepID=A0A8S5Q0P7_9CAUD|nr:MAG TPA: hypothetical protein [Siphoviridae sp. ctR5S1]
MAKISFSGTDELMATLQKANAFDDETQQELLYAAGDIIVEELQNAVRASGFRTEAYASSVKYRKTIKQDKNGDPYITITAVGKNEHGTRRATVLFVLNYGRSAGYGKINGTYFWTKGVRSAQKRVNAELEKILTQKLKERGLL